MQCMCSIFHPLYYQKANRRVDYTIIKVQGVYLILTQSSGDALKFSHAKSLICHIISGSAIDFKKPYVPCKLYVYIEWRIKHNDIF